ncbi:hypothetical protein [Spirosoma spitsbergense]|uniref:hypothetical protein n=1 Tax=Spirosoma spitsbergense TaxID=431554 RepID=UPI00036F8C3A|nr:hypothetical protein [Spirosoma spitsbergense]
MPLFHFVPFPTSMIEADNILSSLSYGVILGVFVVAFYVKSVGCLLVVSIAWVLQRTVLRDRIR